jgi:hypothetical protein
VSTVAEIAVRSPCIGGFFESHEPDGGAQGRSLLDVWTEGRPFAAFVNARSAFAGLVGLFPSASVWMPAFLCDSLIGGALAGRARFYPVEEGFEPNLSRVEAEARTGDLVLIPAYFGLSPTEAVREVIWRRSDLRFVEDRAQALDAGPGVGAGWRLYSPRKLLGVADGGLLVAMHAAAVLPRPGAPAAEAALWAAPTMRRDDPSGRRNAVWHAANQAKEAAMTVAAEAMTAQSLSILSRTSFASLAGPRLRNWGLLDRRLRAWSALPPNPASPPLGYVICLEPDVREALLRALHAERIFAAVHWSRLAAQHADFPREAGWTRQLLTLPCDHRYGAAEMERIADRVADFLR